MPKVDLPPERKKQVEDAIQLSYDLDDFLNRSAAAGYDVSKMKEENAKTRQQLNKTKQAFFPNG